MLDLLTAAPQLGTRSRGIDVLRAVFALWVLFTHAILWSVYVGSDDAVPAIVVTTFNLLQKIIQPSNELHPAVLGFIVLSGYCIHRAGFRTRRGDLIEYGLRRAFRIVPVFMAASVFGIVALQFDLAREPSLAAALSGTTAVDGGCLAAKLSAVAALVPFFHPCSYVGNAPLATVMVEIVLYAFYALAFVLIWNGREAIVWWICVTAACGGIVVAGLAAKQPNLYNWWQNSSLLGFLPYWWIGALVLHPPIQKSLDQHCLWILAGWCAATAVLMGIGPDAVLSEVRKLLLALLVAVLIVRIDVGERSGPALLASLGRSGYSVYAFHAPLMYSLALFQIPWWLNVGCCAALGLFAYAVIERPLIDFGRYFLKHRSVLWKGS